MRLLTVTDSDIIEAIGFGTLMENPGGVPGTFGTLGVVFSHRRTLSMSTRTWPSTRSPSSSLGQHRQGVP